MISLITPKEVIFIPNDIKINELKNEKLNHVWDKRI